MLAVGLLTTGVLSVVEGLFYHISRPVLTFLLVNIVFLIIKLVTPMPLILVLSSIIWTAICTYSMAGRKYLFSHPKYKAGHVSKAWWVIYWYYFCFSAYKNCNARAAAGVPAAKTFFGYILSRFRFFAWENRNMGVAGIETDVSLRAVVGRCSSWWNLIDRESRIFISSRYAT